MVTWAFIMSIFGLWKINHFELTHGRITIIKPIIDSCRSRFYKKKIYQETMTNRLMFANAVSRQINYIRQLNRFHNQTRSNWALGILTELAVTCWVELYVHYQHAIRELVAYFGRTRSCTKYVCREVTLLHEPGKEGSCTNVQQDPLLVST